MHQRKEQRVCNKIAVIPHPPYSPDLAPCDFFLFPKLKLKLKGRRFGTAEEIQAESHRVLDTLTEKDFQEAFQNGGDGGTGVYMREGTNSRVRAADRPCGEFCDFYSVSPENFGSTHVNKNITAGGDFLGLCDEKGSYKHVSDFGRLRSYDRFLIPVHALV